MLPTRAKAPRGRDKPTAAGPVPAGPAAHRRTSALGDSVASAWAPRGAQVAGPQPPGRLDLPRIPGALPHDRTSPAHRPGSLQRRFGHVLARELVRVTVAAPGLGDPVRGPASSLAARHPLTMRHEPDEQPTTHRLTANSKAPDQTRPESRRRHSGTNNRTYAQLRGTLDRADEVWHGPPPTPCALRGLVAMVRGRSLLRLQAPLVPVYHHW